jgi:SAM-dependent methyltransferase
MPESVTRRVLRGIRDTLRGVLELRHITRAREHLEYLDREVSRLNAAARRAAWQQRRRTGLEAQTKASFHFQWLEMPSGAALPNDAAFMREAQRELPAMFNEPPEWFKDRRIADVGCGIGRYTLNFLQLGAVVTACDQSEAALRRTAELCRAYAGRLALKQIDLLEWQEDGDFDAAFSYGVVHHTGNTYLAIENVCRKVRVGGKVFFMVYALPRTLEALREVNLYERLASEVRDLSFEARKDFVERRFGPEKAHGWFDAISPRINDRLTFEELHDLLTELGFKEIEGRVVQRNHYITATRHALADSLP